MASGGTARIGPNAVIQVAAALAHHIGAAAAAPMVEGATGYRLDAMPTDMVDEAEARALATAVLHHFPPAEAAALLRDAGHRTGDYLLAHRIPALARGLIGLLPRRLGLAVLLRAVTAHAWTFAGSGRFVVSREDGTTMLTFHECTICRSMQAAGPVCDYYAGTFERLFRALVSPAAEVVEVECQATGGGACRFAVRGI